MTSLRDRLLSAEDNFLTALDRGGDALSAFDQFWETLMADVELAMDSNSLDDETSTLVQTTTLRIAALADASIDLVQIQDTFTAQLMDQLEGLVSEITLVDYSPNMRARSSSLPYASPPPSPLSNSHIGKTARSSLKRRRSSDSTASPCHKRSRRSTPLHGSFRDTSLAPAQKPKFDCTQRDHIQHVSPSVVALDSTADATKESSPLPARKRRLSEADASSTPRATKRLYMGPRVHAVSDTFPQMVEQSYPTPTNSIAIVATSDHPSISTPTEEVSPHVPLDALTRLPLPTDLILDCFSESYTPFPPSSNASDLDDLLQSLFDSGKSTLPPHDFDTIVGCHVYHSAPPSPSSDDVDTETPSSNHSPASTPSYPSTPLHNPYSSSPLCYAEPACEIPLCGEDVLHRPHDDTVLDNLAFAKQVGESPSYPPAPAPSFADILGLTDVSWDLLLGPLESYIALPAPLAPSDTSVAALDPAPPLLAV
ncbi:hypothetical protein C8T65DRAFT_826602 [Cerioporus squamosus]|nr:hypothetical protein C8T65DRAFT_826602 [Cerioporus squamosus]